MKDGRGTSAKIVIPIVGSIGIHIDLPIVWIPIRLQNQRRPVPLCSFPSQYS
jgi:hypothetical protein